MINFFLANAVKRLLAMKVWHFTCDYTSVTIVSYLIFVAWPQPWSKVYKVYRMVLPMSKTITNHNISRAPPKSIRNLITVGIAAVVLLKNMGCNNITSNTQMLRAKTNRSRVKNVVKALCKKITSCYMNGNTWILHHPETVMLPLQLSNRYNIYRLNKLACNPPHYIQLFWDCNPLGIYLLVVNPNYYGTRVTPIQGLNNLSWFYFAFISQTKLAKIF